MDKHIRRLDTDLARFELEYKEKSSHQRHNLDNTHDLNTTDAFNASMAPSMNSTLNATVTDANALKSRSKKKKVEQQPVIIEEASTNMLPITPSGLLLAQPTGIDVMDMPVDPNEPTYCLCHQVSFGQMIGCDNMECAIEWFHFGCVGLSTKPKGKWYCPICAEKRKKS